MPSPTGLFRTATAAFCLLAVAACSTPTPYQPAATASGAGYTTQQIESNRFRISFKGNSLTPRQAVDTYMMYRAAEVTLQNGFDYFIIVDKDVDKDTAYDNFGAGYGYGGGGWGGWGGRGYGMGMMGGGTGYTRPINSYDAISDIVLYRGKKPPRNNYAYDAREVTNAIGPTLLMPNQPPPPPGAR